MYFRSTEILVHEKKPQTFVRVCKCSGNWPTTINISHLWACRMALVRGLQVSRQRWISSLTSWLFSILYGWVWLQVSKLLECSDRARPRIRPLDYIALWTQAKALVPSWLILCRTPVWIALGTVFGVFSVSPLHLTCTYGLSVLYFYCS